MGFQYIEGECRDGMFSDEREWESAWWKGSGIFGMRERTVRGSSTVDSILVDNTLFLFLFYGLEEMQPVCLHWCLHVSNRQCGSSLAYSPSVPYLGSDLCTGRPSPSTTTDAIVFLSKC